MNDIDLYKKASGEIWGFFRTRMESDDRSGVFWENTVKEIDAICEKYKGKEIERYVIDYIVACYSEISRQSKDPDKQLNAVTYVADLLMKLVRRYVEENGYEEKRTKEIFMELAERRL